MAEEREATVGWPPDHAASTGNYERSGRAGYYGRAAMTAPVAPAPLVDDREAWPESGTDALLAAGRTLAAIAEPRKLSDYGNGLREIAATLKALGDGIEHACARAAETFDYRLDAIGRGIMTFDWSRQAHRYTRDDAELDRDNELKRARDTAIRTAKRALVDLAALIGAMERECGE